MFQLQGQENPTKKSIDCDKGQKISADATTNSPASNKANGKAESDEKRKETSETEDSSAEIQQNIATYSSPEPNVPEKSISPDTPENPGSSDTI